jgi:hypothetical protein
MIGTDTCWDFPQRLFRRDSLRHLSLAEQIAARVRSLDESTGQTADTSGWINDRIVVTSHLEVIRWHTL